MKDKAHIEAGRVAIDLCGGATSLAKELGLKRERIQNWKRYGISRHWVKTISRRSGIPLEALLPEEKIAA